ncbi:MAG: hypothetical protein Q9169_000113 [Polycauliona sp. 2 TL-2023]
MADPFSIAASIFTLAAAAGQLSKAISRIRHFGEVPGRVYALKNDVSDLEVVLRQVGHALAQESLAADNDREQLQQILLRTRSHLTNLGKALERVAKACEGGKVKILSRSAIWWKEKAVFQGFQEDIRSAKANLNLILGAANSRDLQNVMLELRRVTLPSALTQQAEGANNPAPNHRHLAASTCVDTQSHDLSDRLDTLGNSILNEQMQDSSRGDESSMASYKERDNQTLRVFASHRIPCRSWCPCACHAKQKIQSKAPGMVESILGRMFIGYSGFQGLASPRDVSDSRGFTLMRWALYGGMHNYETVQFLMQQGAHIDEHSYDNVWDFIFRIKCNEKEQQALRCITEGGEGDWVAEQNFPLVHKIIFKLSSKSLLDEIVENPNAVYVTDAQNRTALDWATARVQLEDMSLLLGHGADPNNMDVTGRTPVLHAVDSHDAVCLTLILEAGGNPDPVMPHGIFRSSPLTAAGFSGMPALLKLLLEFEANPNACNPEGLTALHSVARTHNIDCALLLLDFGADLNANSRNGRTPLRNLERKHGAPIDEYSPGSRILPIIAEHADVDTMHILASSHPMKVAYDLGFDSIAASREVLQQRPDCNEKLTEAFEELIAIAEAEHLESKSMDSLAESGLFYSARSSFHSDLADAMARLDSTAVSPTDSENFGNFAETLIRL